MGLVPELDFPTVADAIKDYAVFVLDSDGIILTWNQGAARIKGYSSAEILGRSHEVFYPPEELAAGRPRQLLDAAARDGRVEDAGWRLRQDGTRFWADVVISAIRDRDGRLRGFAKVTRDLSERRAFEETLRQSEERLRLMIASVRDYAIFLLDPEGRVETWNPGAALIKGYRADEIIGENFSRFYPPDDLAAGKPALELATATAVGRFEDEGWRVRKDGTRFWANVVISAVRDDRDRLLGFTKVTRDMTERRAAEEQRLQVARAEEAVRDRDAFMAIAAHELRTPLTALQLKLESVVQIAREAGDPRLEEQLEWARRQTGRMAGLIERMLDTARIAAGHLEVLRGRADLGEIAGEIVDDLRDLASGGRTELRLSMAGDLTGEWDRGRIAQVVTNLVSNALKYAPGRPVEVRVRGDGDRVRLDVEDHGIGIPAEDLAKIFDRFHRVAQVGRCAGLGLGLHIARHIVEAHGGTISVTSTFGEGSTFTVELPRR